MRILAIGSHPDDIELGAGGTIAKHILLKDEVYFLVLTFGEHGGEKAEVRQKEAIESARLLGVKEVFFGAIPDRTVSEGVETISVIENVISITKPSRIYTHAPEGSHQDHRNAASATFSAARKVPDILCYESPLTCPSFTGSAFSDITGYIDLKLSAINCFKSQNGKAALKTEAIEGLARFRGFQTSVKYAETFEVRRITI